MLANVYVQDKNKKIYRVIQMREVSSQTICYDVSMDLVCGWDYTDPDENDIQGWVASENFIEDVQSVNLLFYPMSETLTELFEENDFKVIDSCPDFKALKAE